MRLSTVLFLFTSVLLSLSTTSSAFGAVMLNSKHLDRRDGPSQPAIAITLFWFNNIELAICYDMRDRVESISEIIHCNAQDDYDKINNTYALPQTCIPLIPRSERLHSQVKMACKEAAGTFGILVRPSANDGVVDSNQSPQPQ